jgi:hypothetical protein
MKVLLLDVTTLELSINTTYGHELESTSHSHNEIFDAGPWTTEAVFLAVCDPSMNEL